MAPAMWDSCCSYNLIANRSLLHSLRQLSKPINFGTQTSPCTATHVGLLHNFPTQLATAFWGPNLNNNLLSEGYLHRRGGSICTTISPSGVLGKSIKNTQGAYLDHPLLATNNVYPVSAHLLRPPTKPPLPRLLAAFTAAISAAAAKRDAAVRLLHERLDHPSFEVLSQAITNGSIDTDVTTTDVAAYLKRNGPCLACISGKLKDTPHPASDHPRATRPGDTLYLDLHALPSESLGGKKMSIRVVDSFTSCLFVEGCPTKSARDVYLAVARVVVTYFNAHGHRVNTMWTDSESTLKCLRPVLGLLGIQLRLCTPYVHNRVFERYNQTLQARAAATRASLPFILPNTYELQLTTNSAHKFNALPNTHTGPGTCPYTLLTGKKPTTGKSAFGHIHMVALSDDQQANLAEQQELPVNAVDRAVAAICMGHDPLWPSADLFLLLLGTPIVLARIPRSPRLDVLPRGFAIKAAPLPAINPAPIAADVPSEPTPSIADLPTLVAPALPASTTNDSVQGSDINISINDHLPGVTARRPRNAHAQPIALQPQQPVEPAPQQPVEPAPQQAVESAPQQAVEPAPQQPVEPAPQQPVEPVPLQPVEPAPPDPVPAPPPGPPPPVPRPPLEHAPHLHGTRLASRRRPLQALLAMALAASVAAAGDDVNATVRKTALRASAQRQAKVFAAKLAFPPGTTNTDPPFELSTDYILEPPAMVPDEHTLDRARTIANAPDAPPGLLGLIDTACQVELTKLTTQFDTVRALSATNPRERDAVIIGSLFFIKFKRDGRVTARLAACGNQMPSGSFGDCSASTSDHHSHALIVAAYFAEAVKSGRLADLVHAGFDISGAFLQNRLPRSATGGRQVLMWMPRNIPHPLAGKLVEVVGAIYGLPQSNKIFEDGLKIALAQIGFLPAHMPGTHVTTAPDQCVFQLYDTDRPAVQATLVFHVDDCDALSFDTPTVTRLRTHLEKRYGPLAWTDVSPQFTGSMITHYSNGAVGFDMSKHINKLLKSSGADKLPAAFTPCDRTLFDPSNDTTPADLTAYQRLVGALTFISRDRHDITKMVHVHARAAKAPTKGDLDKVIRTLRYLKGTPTLPAVYYTEEGPVLYGHVDTSFANQTSDGTSLTAVHLTIGAKSAPFLSKCHKQTTVALSPCSSEYIGFTPCLQQVMRFRQLLAAVGFPQAGPTTVFADNQPAIDITTAPSIPRKSRHHNVEHHYSRELVANGDVVFVHKNTHELTPDLNTKNHPAAIHHYLTHLTMNTESIPPV